MKTLQVEKQRKRYIENPDYWVSRTNKWRSGHLVQFNAGFIARRHGAPLKDHCELCGRKDGKLERMHLDYSKPLDFTTACRSCHKLVDRTIKDYRFTEGIPRSFGSRHCCNCAKTWPICGRKIPSYETTVREKRKAVNNCAQWESIEVPEVVLGVYSLENFACTSQQEKT